MTHDERRPTETRLRDPMQLATADPAGRHVNHNLVSLRYGIIDI